MSVHKRLSHSFHWIRPEQRISRFGNPLPPKKAETRVPVIWLARKRKELFLVNDSGETFDFVMSESGGTRTEDNDVVLVIKREKYEYANVKPGDAVKIENYKSFFDSDFLLYVSITIKVNDINCIRIFPPVSIGGLEETVIQWNTGEIGKNVTIKKW